MPTSGVVVAPKTIELIFKARNGITGGLSPAVRTVRKLADELVKTEAQYAKLGRRRQHLLRDLDAARAKHRAIGDLLKVEEARERRREALAGRLTGQRAKELEVLRKQGAERLKLLRRELAAAGSARGAVVGELRSVTDQRSLLLGRGRAQVDLALTRSATGLLEQQAALGDRKAAQQVRLASLTRQQVAQQRVLLDVLRSQAATEGQKVAAQRQLNALAAVHYRQQLAAARGPGGGLLRSAAGGALSGAAFAGTGPLGLLAGAGLSGGLGPGAVASGGAGAVAFGLVKAVGEAARFESAMARVRALTGAVGEDLGRLDGLARRLGRTTTFTAEQAAEAMGNFALAGFEVGQIMEATEPALRLAEAGELDLAESTRIVSRIMAGLGIEASGAGEAVDVLTAAMTSANTNLSELGTAFEFVGPIAKTTGFDIRETAAALQVLANRGFAGEKGGTALRQILIKLANQTGEAREKLAELNIELADAEGNIKPLPEVLAEFEGALDGLGSQRRLEVLSTIFEARAAAGFAALLQGGSAELARFEDQLESVDGTAARISEERLDTLVGDATRLGSAVSGAGIAVGRFAGGPLRELTQGLTAAVNEATDLVEGLAGLAPGSPGTPGRAGSGGRGGFGPSALSGTPLAPLVNLGRAAALEAEAAERVAAGSAVDERIAEKQAADFRAAFLAQAAEADAVLAGVLDRQRRRAGAKALVSGFAEGVGSELGDGERAGSVSALRGLLARFTAAEEDRRAVLAAGNVDRETAAELEGQAARLARARLSVENRIAEVLSAQNVARRAAVDAAARLADRAAAGSGDESAGRREAFAGAVEPFGAAGLGLARAGEFGRLSGLVDAALSAARRAVSGFDASVAERRRSIDDALGDERVASLLGSGRSDDAAEAAGLRAAQQVADRRRALLALLDAELVTQAQRVEVMKALSALEQDEAGLVRRAKAGALGLEDGRRFRDVPDATVLSGSRDVRFGALSVGGGPAAAAAAARSAAEAKRAAQLEKVIENTKLIAEFIKSGGKANVSVLQI